MMFRGVRYEIHGVFDDVMSSAINGPLWSLPYELWLYVLLFVLFVIGQRYYKLLVIARALGASIGWGLVPLTGSVSIGPLENDLFFRLGSFFLSGAVIGICWPYLRAKATLFGVLCLIILFIVRRLVPFENFLHSAVLAGAVVLLGASR